VQTSGEIRVDVDRAAAFAFVEKPEQLAQCIPGCTDLQEIGPNRYSAKLTNSVSFVKLSFKVVVEITKIEPPDAIDATITGEAMGVVGRLSATAGVRLADTGPTSTLVTYTVDLGLTGKLGGLGQSVFRAKSEELGRQFGINLKNAIERGAEVRA